MRGVRTAVTLLELLLVLTLIGLLAAFAWPEFGASARAEQLEESAARIKALIGMCRAQAMNQSCRYRITFRLDGTVNLAQQLDPIEAPEEYVKVREDWAQMSFVLDDVWIEAVLLLPQGPPPILIEDDQIKFDETMELAPVPLESFEQEVNIDFEPDGSSDSLRWVLRDYRGRGLQMTLDGRLGRVEISPVEPIAPDEVQRPQRQPVVEKEDERDTSPARGNRP